MIGTAYWYMHTDQWRNDGYSRRRARLAAGRRATWTACTPPTRSRSRRGSAGCRSTRSSTATRSTSRTRRGRRRRRRGRRRGEPTSPSSCTTGRCSRRSRTSTPRRTGRARWCSGGPTCSAPRPRATSTSSSTCSAPTPTCWRTTNADAPRPTRRASGTTRRPRASSTCWSPRDFRMTSTTLLSDVVFPAATWYEKHDLSSTDMHPFVHAFTPAIDPPWEAKTDFEMFHPLARESRSWPRTHLGVRQRPGQRAAAARHPRRDRAARAASSGTGRAATSRRCPARPCRCSRSSSATTPRSPTSSPPSARWPTGSASRSRTSPTGSRRRSTGWPRTNGVMLGGAGDGRPAIDTDVKLAEAILTFSGTTNGELAVAGLPDPRAAGRQAARRPGRGVGGEADHLRRHPGRAGAGDHLAGVVGLGDRRTALRAVHGQHRAAQAVPHPDRPDALLPRPRLDDRPRRGAADLPATAGHAPAVRRAEARPRRREAGHRPLPDPALEVVDPLRVPGQPVHARRSRAAARRSG